VLLELYISFSISACYELLALINFAKGTFKTFIMVVIITDTWFVWAIRVTDIPRSVFGN
jgi:hypothetical protein